MFRKVKIIANPAAGNRKGHKNIFNQVVEFFSQNSHQCTLETTLKRGDAHAYAQSAVEKNVDVVVVVGGDGTINEAGSALINSETVMGIVPSGSGNGLARTLRLPLGPEEACKIMTPDNIIKMDVGKANERYFFSVVGFGFDAQVGKCFDSFGRRGPLPYFYLSAREYLTYKPERLVLEFNDTSIQIAPFIVAAANGQQYGNNAVIAPQAKVDDGLLDLCIVHQASFLNLFEALPKLFRGKFEEYSGADFYKTQRLCVERAAAGYINLDGEAVLEEAIVDITVLPNSLSIFAPSTTSGATE